MRHFHLSSLFDFLHKHRDAEAFAWRLSWKQGAMPFRKFAPLAGVLGMEMRWKARA
jgi:hypothetical protein